jgi:HAD superfamily hydrolase (TIGR01509 family)
MPPTARARPAHPDFDVLLFDLGGVLVELGDFPILPAWTSLTEAQLRDRWLHADAVRAFESGRIDEATFATAVVAEFDLQVTPELFLDTFRQWPRGLYPGAVSFLQKLGEAHPIACLSNTNRLHWPQFEAEPGFLDCFANRFVSFELGLMKPDLDIFQHVSQALEVDTQRILFLDDNQLNVDSARQAGLTADLAYTLEGVKRTLRNRGLW